MVDSARYISSIDTMYADGFDRESLFRSSGDLLAPAERPATFVARLWLSLRHWQMKRAGRLALHELTDDQLRDIGVTRVQAEQEVQKSRLLML